MPITEPVTLLTDYLLAGVALWLGGRLAEASSRTGSWPLRLWAVAFAVGAASAAAGGTVHGFRPVLGPMARGFLWQSALLGSALAGALLVAALGFALLRGRGRVLALAALGAALVVELALVSSAGLTRHAVWGGAATIVLLLALALLLARHDRAPLAWLALGLLLAAAGLGVQAFRVSPHPYFNHNDLCHVLLTAALWPIYRAGLCLQPRAGGSVTRAATQQ